MINLSIPAGQYPSLGYDGSITFAGVLQNEFNKTDSTGLNIGLSKRWNDNTAAQYSRDYLDRLLPTMTKLFGNEKPMHTYTETDFEKILVEITSKYHYAERTVMHYRFLLWIVYRAGFECGLYPDNIFWDELIDPMDNQEEFEKRRVAALTRIRKSFSIKEDIMLMQWFLSLNPATTPGPEVALAFMYFSGCRNNEACGADFGAFHALPSHPETAVFDMFKTTVVGSNQVKSGGKSSNAPRTLPIHPLLFQFLQKRKAWIERQVVEGKLSLPKGIHSVDQLPIACIGTDYITRAQTGDLSRAGRTLFQKLGIHKSELAVLHQILFSEEFRQTQIIEKDPTTYLFRRNVATRLYHLGFEWTSIQYWIAHEIDDSLLMRSYFADEDILHQLSQEYSKHPIFTVMSDLLDNAHTEKRILSPSEELCLVATANEPCQQIEVSLLSINHPINIVATELSSVRCGHTNANILNNLYRAYSSTYRQLRI